MDSFTVRTGDYPCDAQILTTTLLHCRMLALDILRWKAKKDLHVICFQYLNSRCMHACSHSACMHAYSPFIPCYTIIHLDRPDIAKVKKHHFISGDYCFNCNRV